MALALYRCPQFQNCKGQIRALRGSVVGHVCHWNKNRFTDFVQVADEQSAK